MPKLKKGAGKRKLERIKKNSEYKPKPKRKRFKGFSRTA